MVDYNTQKNFHNCLQGAIPTTLEGELAQQLRKQKQHREHEKIERKKSACGASRDTRRVPLHENRRGFISLCTIAVLVAGYNPINLMQPMTRGILAAAAIILLIAAIKNWDLLRKVLGITILVAIGAIIFG